MSSMDIARAIIAGIIVIGFVTTLGVYSFMPITKSDLIPGMIGVFGTGFITVVYYYFPKSP